MSQQENKKNFADQSVVFTGRLASLSRKEAQELVLEHGGLIQNHVTKTTSFVVIGEEGFVGEIVTSRKIKRAETINTEDGNIRIITESEFLEMLGIEGKADLEERYYSLERIQHLFPGLRSDIVKYFSHWRLFKPVVMTNAHQYYEFKDLITFREINNLLSLKFPLREIAKRLTEQSVPSPQLTIEFEEDKPKGTVLSLKPETKQPTRTAEEWYEIAYQVDGTPETYDQAIEAYKNALTLDPKYIEAMINLANIYFHKNDLPLAVQLLEKAIDCDSSNYLACYNLANIYDESGELQNALKLYEQTLKIIPQYEPAIFNMALTYEKLDDIPAAQKQWRLYLEIEPDGEWAAIAKEHLLKA